MKATERNIEEKCAQFRRSIMGQAKAQMDEIDRDLEAFRAQELAQCKADARGNSHQIVDEEQGRIRERSGRAVSERRSELRRQLCQRREILTDEIFQQVREELARFVSGPEYPAYLRELAKKAASFRRAEEEVVIEVRQEDLAYRRELSRACGGPCRVEEGKGITIGGLRFSLPQRRLGGDETLDSAIEEQRQWFYENFGLFLSGEVKDRE